VHESANRLLAPRDTGYTPAVRRELGRDYTSEVSCSENEERGHR
jgi:hypothetical protein